MNGEDRTRSLKKFSAIALVLLLGAAFHTLCWTSLFNQDRGVERSPLSISCPCAVDQRYSLNAARGAGNPGNCASVAPALVLSH